MTTLDVTRRTGRGVGEVQQTDGDWDALFGSSAHSSLLTNSCGVFFYSHAGRSRGKRPALYTNVNRGALSHQSETDVALV